ncbi:MAG: BrnT family toxin [Endozoicomonas sp.]
MSNRDKHGIDFDEAPNLWNDESRMIFPASVEGQSRYLMVAKDRDRHWTAVYTLREGGGRISGLSLSVVTESGR